MAGNGRRRLAPGEPPGEVTGGPFPARCPAGKYAWCRCAKSGLYPYCDGTHRTCDPPVQPVKIVLDEATQITWCACAKTQTPPFCDGTRCSDHSG